MLVSKVAIREGALDLAPYERARLVRLCSRLTGDADAAEDLAQETLLEAWRHLHRLTDPAGRGAWLAAIARNVCHRWSRDTWRERARLVPLAPTDGDDPDGPPSALARLTDAAGGVELTLEREELVELLDRALALLPPQTRDVLVARYVHESPHAELAARLGLSEEAVAKRIQRGRLALRRVLTTGLRHEAAAYGIAPAEAGGFQETRIWCPICGRRRLTCRIDRATGEAIFLCADCCPEVGMAVAGTDSPELLEGVTSFKAIVSRQLDWIHAHVRHALTHDGYPCPRCGRPMRVGTYGPDNVPAFIPSPLRRLHGAVEVCDRCAAGESQTLQCLILDLPEGQRFWRAHGRIRMLPERVIEYAGRPAVVGGLESVAGTARLEVVSARDTFEVLALDGVSEP